MNICEKNFALNKMRILYNVLLKTFKFATILFHYLH